MAVTITFRTDDFAKWGAGYGSNLSATQIDINFWNVQQAIETLQDDMPEAAVGIVDFEVVGNQFYVNMTDDAVLGPYPLPVVSWVSRGVWTPSTPYAVSDVITVGAVAYAVIFAHVSASTFDPGDNDGLGHDYYNVLLDLSSQVVPQVDRRTDNTFSPTRADISKYWRMDSAGDGNGEIVVTINSGIFLESDEMHFRQVQDGVVSIVAGPGVLLNGIEGHTKKTAGTGSVLTVKCVDPDEFDVFGMLGF